MFAQKIDQLKDEDPSRLSSVHGPFGKRAGLLPVILIHSYLFKDMEGSREGKKENVPYIVSVSLSIGLTLLKLIGVETL